MTLFAGLGTGMLFTKSLCVGIAKFFCSLPVTVELKIKNEELREFSALPKHKLSPLSPKEKKGFGLYVCNLVFIF